MKKRQKIAQLDNILKNAKVGDKGTEEISVDGVEVKGKDGGEHIILKHILFQPNYEAMRQDGIDTEEKIKETVKNILEKSLFDYCKSIGWWPKDNLDPYKITLEKDGYTLSSHLVRDKKNKNAKSVTEISDRIGINEK